MLQRWQVEQIEGLFRQAVLLSVNPAGGPGPCEMGCGRLGRDAHHVVFRSQEPALRLFYEPRFAALLCHECHAQAHVLQVMFSIRLLAVLDEVNPAKFRCLSLYRQRHDLIRAPKVTWKWQVEYLKRCIARSQKRWADTYNRDEMPAWEVDL